MTTVYIKPMTWAGETLFYVGINPSNPQSEPGYRLGGYFIAVQTLASARAIAKSEAARMKSLGHDYGRVVECPHYVGL